MCRVCGMPSYPLTCAWKVKHLYGDQGVRDHRESFASVVLAVLRNGACDLDREPWSCEGCASAAGPGGRARTLQRGPCGFLRPGAAPRSGKQRGSSVGAAKAHDRSPAAFGRPSPLMEM